MRRPSEKLRQLLHDLQLCTDQELAACERRVQRLCHELPDFDSVWLDALVQQHTLTPWQATVLQSSSPGRLRIDEYSCREQLGRFSLHAVSVESGRHVVLHRIGDRQVEDASQQAWLRSQLERLEPALSSSPPSLGLPRRLLTVPSADSSHAGSEKPRRQAEVVFAASSFVPGWTVQELLIRGGRIPWPVVAEIGAQLLQGLGWLEAQGTVHGDINLHNVRLTPQGNTVLVGALCHPAVPQGVSLTADLRLKDVATLPPERIGSGTAVDARGELYSLGCVLWQLLTARPPFLSADPVSRVLQAQERDVADVRQLVPECPDQLARLIHSFTRRSPELRPESIAVAADRWPIQSALATKQTRRLLRRMPDRSLHLNVGRSTNANRRSVATSVATAAAMLLMFAAYGVHRGLLPDPLHVSRSASSHSPIDQAAPERLPDSAGDQTSGAPPEKTASGLFRMPQPDAAGVVVLQSGGIYEAEDLVFAGVMHLETSDNQPSIVRCSRNEVWQLRANQIVLNNIVIQATAVQEPHATADTASAEPEQPTLVRMECDVLSLQRCVVDSGPGSNRDRALHWLPKSGVTSVVSFTDCAFLGSGYAVWLDQPPERCNLSNVLFTTRRAAVRCNLPTADRSQVQMHMTHVTQTTGGSFLDVFAAADNSAPVRVVLLCGESVLAVKSGLVQFAGPAGWPLSSASVEFLLPERGNPTVIPPDVRTAIGFDNSLKAVVGLQESQIKAEALLIAVPVFRGEQADVKVNQGSSHPFAAFELLDYEGPKLSPLLPGVDISALPHPSPTVL